MNATRTELGHGAWVELTPGFAARQSMDELVAELPLQQESLVLFGRSVKTPRLTSWHGDPGCAYRYSGRRFEPADWTPRLSALRDALARNHRIRFNSVLANYYRDGSDSMGAHSDDERELGPTRDDVRIASVSLGASRRFCLRSRTKEGPRVDFNLGGGDLLVMGGTTQQHFRHHIPKTKQPVGPRLNLTFRLIVG